MEHDFWHERWQQREIGFHRSEINPDLMRWFPTLNIPQGGRVLVPLCGKSHDLRWLCEAGYEVVGVELSPLAVREFFEEGGAEPECREDGPFQCLACDGITLLCGDFFALDRNRLGKIDAVYDRAALVALPPEMRAQYRNHLHSLLDPGTPILTITYEYDQAEVEGPPFAVWRDEVRRLDAGCQSLDLLDEYDALPGHKGMEAKGVTAMRESVWRTVR